MESVNMEAVELARQRYTGNQAAVIGQTGLDVEKWLSDHRREIVKVKQNGGSTLYCLKECVFDPSHSPNDAAIRKAQDGKLSYQCFHNGCQGRTWKEAREIISGNESLKAYMPQAMAKEQTAGQITDPTQHLKTGLDLQGMDINIEWAIQDLIPKGSLTTLTGKAGIGKTTLLLNIATAISTGERFLGQDSVKMPAYYIDFENPLSIAVDRARTLNITTVNFWLQSFEVPPPRIDSDAYGVYKLLPSGLLIFDSLRASQMGDENSSKDMALAMQRYKELRDHGHTVILIHHTQKANEQGFRGSMAILDLADHVLNFFPVRKPGDEAPAEGDDLDNMTFYFGTKDKTRFNQCKLYLRRANGRFEIAEHPDDEKITLIKDLLTNHEGITQKDLLRLIKEELSIGKASALRLLKQGEHKEVWTVETGGNNSRLYRLSGFPPYIKGGKTGKPNAALSADTGKPGIKDARKSFDNVGFSGFSGGEKENRKTEGESTDFRQNSDQVFTPFSGAFRSCHDRPDPFGKCLEWDAKKHPITGCPEPFCRPNQDWCWFVGENAR
jgi:archaellum biogenesis ATPase FlaH